MVLNKIIFHTITAFLFFLLYLLINFKVSGSELDELFLKLKNSPNAMIAQKYENKIWQSWLTDGSNKINNLK